METIRIAGAQIPINDHDIDFNKRRYLRQLIGQRKMRLMNY